MNLKISILLAIYNDEKYLEECILSILNQSYKNFELLIGFNGTHDRSKEIVSQFDDERIKTFDYGDDKGKAKTLNKMLPHATGDWVAIQDGDDLWLSKKLEEQVKMTNEYDVVGTFCHYINENSQFIGQPSIATTNDDIIAQSVAGINQIINSSSIVKKSCVIESGGWDENWYGIEDYDMWLKLIKKGCRFCNIPKVLVFHRLHQGSNFNTKTYDLNALLRQHKLL